MFAITDPLNVEVLSTRLAASTRSVVVVEVAEEVTSTNEVLRQRAMQDMLHGHVLLAESQTQGKGRLGRVWHTPKGKNLALTLAWSCDPDPRSLAGISLAVGAAVAESLEKVFGVDMQLKWPNDMYLDGRKCGGVLVETLTDGQQRSLVLIGVGLNIMPLDTEVDQPVADLSSHVGRDVPRNNVAACVIEALVDLLQAWEAGGFSAWRERWQARDLLRDVAVTISGGQTLTGVGCGVDDTGALLLQTAEGIEPVFAGDASVRKEQPV